MKSNETYKTIKKILEKIIQKNHNQLYTYFIISQFDFELFNNKKTSSILNKLSKVQIKKQKLLY